MSASTFFSKTVFPCWLGFSFFLNCSQNFSLLLCWGYHFMLEIWWQFQFWGFPSECLCPAVCDPLRVLCSGPWHQPGWRTDPPWQETHRTHKSRISLFVLQLDQFPEIFHCTALQNHMVTITGWLLPAGNAPGPWCQWALQMKAGLALAGSCLPSFFCKWIRVWCLRISNYT